jgi:hypothetical protein
VAYSWSHAIDNQTDALGADFFNLNFTSPFLPGAASLGPAQFTRQFDSRVDRGSSDFDQRHNLVFYSHWFLPPALPHTKAGRLLRNWELGQLAAFRSGFPFSVNTGFVAPRPGDPIQINRASLSASGAPIYVRQSVAGGERLLNRDAFQASVGGALGNTGRNAFRGPGFFSLDLSLGRSFQPAALGEGRRITVRAEAFNLLNHSNLDTPSAVYSPTATDFGVALYGRKGTRSGYPGLLPLDETGRQIQLSLRFSF